VEIAILGLKPKIQKKINSKKKGKNGGNIPPRIELNPSLSQDPRPANWAM
jgi:hypothetical protein